MPFNSNPQLIMRPFYLLLFILLTQLGLEAKLHLPTVFSDQMVLQRNQAVPVWGQAEPGARITVVFADQTKTTRADAQGEWRVELEPMPASAEGRSMTVHSSLANEPLQFNDILLGEVWLCSGQSNMFWPMRRSKNGEQMIAQAEHPQIRLYQTPAKYSKTPQAQIDATWTRCTPQSVADFSAVAYYFGRKLQQELGVPVGLLHSSWGGSRIEPWTPPSGFAGIESLAEIHQQALNFPADFGTKTGRAITRKEKQYPSAIYNGMIHAHVPFALKGII